MSESTDAPHSGGWPFRGQSLLERTCTRSLPGLKWFYSNSCYNDFSVFRFTKTIRIAVFLSRFFKLTKFQNVSLHISNSLWNINQTFISWNFVANRNSSNLKILCLILSGLLVYPVTKPRSWITAGSMAPEFRSLSSSCAHSIRHCQTSKQAGVVNYQYY